MVQVKYVGQYKSVLVRAIDRDVVRDEVIEVDEALAESLLEQESNWVAVVSKERKAAGASASEADAVADDAPAAAGDGG